MGVKCDVKDVPDGSIHAMAALAQKVCWGRRLQIDPFLKMTFL